MSSLSSPGSRDKSMPDTDLETAMDHAERMLDSFDRTNRELRTLQVVRLATIAGALLAAAIAVAATATGPAAAIGLAALSLIVAAGFALWLRTPINAVRRQRQRDLSGLVDLSRVVRDLLPVVAKSGHWSELKHLTMRARVARFPISEETR